MRRNWQVFLSRRVAPGLLVVLSLAAVSCGEAEVEGFGLDCPHLLVVGGREYNLGGRDDGILPTAELGELLGEVRQIGCGNHDLAGDQEQIWVTGLPAQGDVWTIVGEREDSVLAVVTGPRTRVFLADIDPLGWVIDGPVESIGITSESDQETATGIIDDPQTVAMLMADARSSERSGGVASGDLGYLVEFRRPSGVVIVVPFRSETRRLDNLAVGQIWADEIRNALAEGPTGGT